MRAFIDEQLDRLWHWWRSRHAKELLGEILEETSQLDMRIVGRTLLQAAIVGVAAGLVGAAFFASLELMQRVLLEGFAGYTPLRAQGEMRGHDGARDLVPWLIVLLPALGGLACGL